MRIVHLEDIAPHYAETLRRWREAFHERLDEVRALGYSEEFIRMWTYYLCYCEGAFDERAIGNVQLHIAKPNARVDVVGF
jgi:cyclopropane-fatty-acyl-phospholipid synthase